MVLVYGFCSSPKTIILQKKCLKFFGAIIDLSLLQLCTRWQQSTDCGCVCLRIQSHKPYSSDNCYLACVVLWWMNCLGGKCLEKNLFHLHQLIPFWSSSSSLRQCPREVPCSEPRRRTLRGVAGAKKWLPLLLCQVSQVATDFLKLCCFDFTRKSFFISP